MSSRFLALGWLIVTLFLGPAAADDKQPDDKQPDKKTGPKITVSKETTHIEAPLDKDGYVNYIEALNQQLSKGVTVENNAAVVICSVIGPNGGELRDNEAYRTQLYKRLGIEPLPDKGDYYISLGDLAKEAAAKAGREGDAGAIAQGYYDEQTKAMEQSWSKTDFPNIARWIAVNEKPLAKFSEGMQRERCFLPLITGDEPNMLIAVLLPIVQGTREMARLLKARAMLRLDEGNVAGAWEDLMTCHRLARHIAQGPTLIERLVAIAIDSIALDGGQIIAQSGQLMTDQALKCRGDLEKLSPIPRMVDSLDTAERFMFLDATQHLARGTADVDGMLGIADAGTGAVLTKLLSQTLIDWNEPMKMANTWYDKLVAQGRKPTYLQRAAAAKVSDDEIKELVVQAKDPKKMALKFLLSGSPRKAAGQQIGTILIALLLPALNAASQAEARGDMYLELTKVTFALAAHQSDRGALPKTLDELAPKYIAAVPADFYVEKPLVYSLTEKGYVLYALGPNGKDDKGVGPYDRGADGGDDIAIRFPRPKKE